jgi:hypothetical protein
MKHQIKQYPKLHKDVYEILPNDKRPGRISSTFGSAEVLAEKFRVLYEKTFADIFKSIVRQVWLEQHFTYKDVRRRKRSANGYGNDWAWGFFMHSMVGVSQKPVTSNFCFTTVSTYLKDFFPDFMLNDPFEEPEAYLFPYKYVTLAHLSYVYEMHNRLEMLAYAEEKQLSFGDFANWAYNWAHCYNEDVGEDTYELVNDGYFWKRLRNRTLPKDWAHEKFTFDMHK